MRVYFRIIIVTIAVFLIYLPAASENQSTSTENRRWGITPKEPLEEEEKNKANTGEKSQDKKKKNDDEDLQDDKKTRTGKKSATERTIEKEKTGQPIIDNEMSTGKKNGNKVTGEKPKEEDAKRQAEPATGKRDTKTLESQSKKPGSQKQQLKRIKWKNEKQKIKCEGYLEPLKENFLKARHYSIQGQACGTAEYSQNFLKIVEKCKQDCPQNFLAQKGYTKRIVRNLSWLEKLGAERCPELKSNRKSVELE